MLHFSKFFAKLNMSLVPIMWLLLLISFSKPSDIKELCVMSYSVAI